MTLGNGINHATILPSPGGIHAATAQYKSIEHQTLETEGNGAMSTKKPIR